MCVGVLSGCTGRLKMLYPVSHKVNKTASADEAKLCYSFVILACNVKRIYTEGVYDKATAGGFT